MTMQRVGRLAGIVAIIVSSASARAQGRGMMMGARHDSATMAEMAVIHELIRSHDRITRTVTNLPDGIRTVTESSDSLIAQRIKQHVVTMDARVLAGNDPGLPMESPALRTIYRNGAKIRTLIDTTARGTIVVQTSADSETVAALQQHASEVTDLVRRGMAAMHEAMMRNRGTMSGMMPGMAHPDTTAADSTGRPIRRPPLD
jgi:hypothetical protein